MICSPCNSPLFLETKYQKGFFFLKKKKKNINEPLYVTNGSFNKLLHIYSLILKSLSSFLDLSYMENV